MQKIREIKNLNEIIFTWYIFSHFVFLPISIFGGDLCYKVFYIVNTLILLIISLIKNKKLFTKQDVILLMVALAIFIIDFMFRKNSYTLQTYIYFFRYSYIPCYFLSRTKNVKNILKYLSFFSKIIMIAYIFEPLFNYNFTNSYMGYGYTTMLPAFFAIYAYFLVRKNITDILFLILGFIAITIFGNRACLLSIIFMFILTSKLLIRVIKKICNKKVRIKKNETIKKLIIILILFVVSFAVNYSIIIGIPNFMYSQKLSESTNSIGDINNNIVNDIDNITENTVPKKELSFTSYSISKYEEALDGKYETIMSGRMEIYSNAIKVIQETYSLDIVRSLFGNGTGYYRSLNDGRYTHSIIFDVMIEYGIVGLILMGGLFLWYFFKWLKNAKKDKFLFGAYLICQSFPRLLLSLFFQKEMNLFLFIIFVATYFPIKRKIKIKRKLLENNY